MTVKEILEKAKSGELKLKISYIQDFKVSYCGGADFYLEAYKKASRKNAAQKYLNIRALLNREAVVIEITNLENPIYPIITRRSFEGPFSKPLPENEKIIFE